ncbi:MAG: hypothetical protein HYR88_08085 [Verrucomicrobia bacterium]|nr:hypothetical protein [Verrucomicrobiota bacterium]
MSTKLLAGDKKRRGAMRTTTGLSLPTTLKDAADRQARREHRSLSSLISVALERYLREVGAWTDADLDDAGVG